MHHLQPFRQSGLWISIGTHAMDLYFRLQKTDTAISCIIPSLVTSIMHAQTSAALYFSTAFILCDRKCR
jgi:hypothetical protein